MGQDCLPGTHLWWGPLSQFLASCPTTSRSTLTFLVSPSSWALTYSTGWDDGARKGVYDMSGVPTGRSPPWWIARAWGPPGGDLRCDTRFLGSPAGGIKDPPQGELSLQSRVPGFPGSLKENPKGKPCGTPWTESSRHPLGSKIPRSPSRSLTLRVPSWAVRVSDWENEWVTPTSVSFTWIYPRPHRPSL